jgi:hypothetical protein
VVHRNAPLSETGRLRLARCVVDDGWPLRRAAERFQVSHTTAARWAARYRQAGAAGMADRPSKPRSSPARTPRRTERRIVGLRVSKRLGPARIAFRLGLAPSTVHAVLVRYACRASRTWTAAPASRSAATNATGPAFGDQRIGIIFRDEDARTPIIGLVPAAGEYWSGSMYPRVLVLPGLGGGGTVESCRRQGDRWARDVWAPGSCHFRGICLSWQLTHLPVSELPLARRWR